MAVLIDRFYSLVHSYLIPQSKSSSLSDLPLHSFRGHELLPILCKHETLTTSTFLTRYRGAAEDPYPNIDLRMTDSLDHACLILTPPGGPIHLTVRFPSKYALTAPSVTIESTVDHPNVFGSYICASILNTREGYTRAYTLKGIAIQLLSFFCSDRLEQAYGGSVDLTSRSKCYGYPHREFRCIDCGFQEKATHTFSLPEPAGSKAIPTPSFIHISEAKCYDVRTGRAYSDPPLWNIRALERRSS